MWKKGGKKMQVSEWQIKELLEDGELPIYRYSYVIAPASMDAEEVRNLWERRYGEKVVSMEEIKEIGIDGVLEYPDVLEVRIEKIAKAKGKEIFGEKAGESAEDEYFVIYLVNEEYGISFREPVRDSIKQGKVPERSKLGHWVRSYGAPQIGQTVKAIKDSKGFYRVKLI